MVTRSTPSGLELIQDKLSIMFHCTEFLNKKISINKWNNFNPDVRSKIIMDVSMIIDLLNYQWWEKSKTPDLDKLKFRVLGLWRTIFTRLLMTTSVIDDKDALINFYVPKMSPIVVQLNDVYIHELHINQEELLLELQAIVKRLLTDEDVDILTLSLIKLTKSLRMSFQEIFVRYVSEIAMIVFRLDNHHEPGTYNHENDMIIVQNWLTDPENIDNCQSYDSIYANIDFLYRQSRKETDKAS